MGYYVTLEQSNVAIPEEKAEAALAKLQSLQDTHAHLRHGGQYSGGEKKAAWFSWMPADLREITTLDDMLEHLGFEIERTDGLIKLNGYDSKIGQEELFVWALTPFIVSTDDDAPLMEWVGEDHSRWQWTWEDGKMITKEGSVAWTGNREVTF